MSISALLSNADEPANDNHNTNARAPQPSKTNSIDRVIRHSPESTTKLIARQGPAARTTSTSFHSIDNEAVDMEPGTKGSGKKNSSFRDFKYHDSMNLVDNDPDKTDTEVDDDDTFAAERVEYLKNSRKRQLEIEDQESERRKVDTVPLCSGKLCANYYSDVALFTKTSFTSNSTATPNHHVTAHAKYSTKRQWSR